ncbi:hypothetical protein BIW11_14208 [Tropilaelaps mercedesae]|uniref:Uncharacterized protein n=1 Tax=Tropilaelaps mercedesae TaxID=418985 RepID=A0A1V9WYU6_9ACAR|nr:hypothetical protein BIW11_14208 [Tropilaelaps mercedesae]
MADLANVAENAFDGALTSATGLPIVTTDRLFCDGVPWEKLRNWPALATLLVLVVINFVVIFGKYSDDWLVCEAMYFGQLPKCCLLVPDSVAVGTVAGEVAAAHWHLLTLMYNVPINFSGCSKI